MSRVLASYRPMVRAAYGLLTVGLFAFAGYTLGVGKPRLHGVATALYLVLMYGAAVGCAAGAIARRGERAAWAALSASLMLWATGDAIWDYHYGPMAEPPFPNVSDAFYLACYPLQYAGVLLLLRARLHAIRPSLWLDGAVGGLAVAALGVAVLFPVVLRV